MRKRLLIVFFVSLLLIFPFRMTSQGQQEAASQEKAAADELLAEARQVYSQQGPREALPLYEGVLEAYRAIGDRLGEGIVLGYIGNCYKHFGEYDKALDLLHQVLEVKRSLNARLEIGKTLNHLGLVHWEMGDYDPAIERFLESLQVADEMGHRQLQAALLNNLSLVYDEQGDYRKSQEQYERSLALHRELGDRESEGATLGNIGGVHYLLGNFRKAIGYYAQSYAISRELSLKPSQSQDLGNLALSHLELDENSEALKLLEQALLLAREAGLKKEEGDWLTGRGIALLRRGDYSDALVNYRQALEIYEKAEMKRELVEARQYLAEAYLRLGDTASSRRELEKALSLAESIGHKRGAVASLTLLADLAWYRQKYEVALSHYSRALSAAQDLGEQDKEAGLLIQLGRVETERGNYQAAQTSLEQALAMARRQGMKTYQATALLGQAELLRRQAQNRESLALYKEAIELAESLQNPEVTWRLYHGQGRALEALERYQGAIASYRAAIEQIETMRGRIREEPFRAGFMEDKYEVYVDLVRLLLKLGRTAEAFFYVEKSRARAYLDLLGNGRIEAGGSGLAGKPDEERALRKKIEQLRKLLEREHARPQQEQRTSAVETFSQELTEAQHQYALLLAELRTADPEYASFVAISPAQVSAVQNLLSDGEALLEYFFTKDSLTIFVITPEQVTHIPQAVREKDLRAKVELFRDRLRPGVLAGDDWRGPAESLRQLLIAPVEEAGLLNEVDHLYVVPQGVLHYLPFAALWKPKSPEGEFLVERYQLAYLPSASTLRFCRQKRRPKRSTLLALAPSNTGLRFTHEEALAVRELFPGEGRAVTGRDASESLCKRNCGDYTVLHFATHGHLNKLNPLFSRIDLEWTNDEDGRLEVFEIMGLQLNADLVTLSACNTALGSGYFSELPAGDDWVGLTRAFIYAGTPTVVATLWEVDDRSTTELMKAFYRYLPQMSKAEALAQAQRDLLRSHSASRQAPTGTSYRNPYYWAAFVLVGDAQ